MYYQKGGTLLPPFYCVQCRKPCVDVANRNRNDRLRTTRPETGEDNDKKLPMHYVFKRSSRSSVYLVGPVAVIRYWSCPLRSSTPSSPNEYRVGSRCGVNTDCNSSKRNRLSTSRRPALRGKNISSGNSMRRTLSTNVGGNSACPVLVSNRPNTWATRHLRRWILPRYPCV